MKKQMTEWFPTHIKPVNVGVYEVQFFAPAKYAYFDGKLWGRAQYSLDGARQYKSANGACQDKEWRGFTEKQS